MSVHTVDLYYMRGTLSFWYHRLYSKFKQASSLYGHIHILISQGRPCSFGFTSKNVQEH